MYRVCQSEEGDVSSHTGTSGELHQSNKKKYEKYFNFIVKYCITSRQPQITILRRFLNPTLGETTWV